MNRCFLWTPAFFAGLSIALGAPREIIAPTGDANEFKAHISRGAPDPAWRIHDANRPPPPKVMPSLAGQPPSDAVVLFNGRDVAEWVSLEGAPTQWRLRDGCLESVAGAGYARTLRNFGDCQLHLEFSTPTKVEGEGQGRGNSGVFLMGRYEVQVLDSHDNRTYSDGSVGAVYGQYPPLVNAGRPPGEWQIYDIIFTRPRFDARGKVMSPARVTVLLNGVLVQNNAELTGPTGWLRRDPYQAHPDKLPIALQDHGNPVRYRNIWVRDLEGGPPEFTYGQEILDRVTGVYRLNPEMTIEVLREGDGLVAQWRHPQHNIRYPLVAQSPLQFFVRVTDVTFLFHANPQGRIDRLTLTVGGGAQEAKRE